MQHSGHVIVIGASAGGVSALLDLCAQLPRFFPAPVCIVQHIGSNPSLLPELMRFKGPNHAMHAQDGQRLTAGTLHIAPPDRHMLLDGDVLRLTRGPKENHARPAVDPLFRSAALTLGPQVIGVVLTGFLDDGTAGLRAIKACGGIAIVQDPATAAEPEMPASALRHVEVDHCVPLSGIGDLLLKLVGRPRQGPRQAPPESLVREVAINRGAATLDNLAAIATQSPLTCPDCGGGLWEMNDGKPLRYRCHTGHAYSNRSLASAQAEAAELVLRGSVRALRERELLLRRLASVAAASGDAGQAAAGVLRANQLGQQILKLVEIAESEHDGTLAATDPAS